MVGQGVHHPLGAAVAQVVGFDVRGYVCVYMLGLNLHDVGGEVVGDPPSHVSQGVHHPLGAAVAQVRVGLDVQELQLVPAPEESAVDDRKVVVVDVQLKQQISYSYLLRNCR